jgi:hypothetical protein
MDLLVVGERLCTGVVVMGPRPFGMGGIGQTEVRIFPLNTDYSTEKVRPIRLLYAWLLHLPTTSKKIQDTARSSYGFFNASTRPFLANSQATFDARNDQKNGRRSDSLRRSDSSLRRPGIGGLPIHQHFQAPQLGITDLI